MEMPEWIVDLSVPAMVVVGIVIVAIYWIKEVGSKKGPTPCAHVIQEPMKKLMVEFEAEQEKRLKADSKQVEALNSIVLALTSIAATNNETLRRVCDIERAIK